jgi:uncharacterized protein
VGFLACEHLTGLERAAIARLVQRPMRNDPEIDVLAKRGEEHERRFLADLAADGRRVTSIAVDGSAEDRAAELRRAAEETTAAIRRGDDVIYQATFFDGRWRGHADFLLRVDARSDLGPWSYEVADTKLARHTKAGALLQVCVYSELLAAIQGRLPEQVHIALGGAARRTETFRLADFFVYYQQVRERFERVALSPIAPAYPPAGTYPDPVEHCEVCRWNEICTARRRADDHLSLVAGISGRQRRALVERGISTRTALGELKLPVVPPLEGTSAGALARVREQARLQVEGERARQTLHELLDPARLADGKLAPNRGLTSLPAPSAGDVFFDIEGDPYAFDEGLDYLFGVLEPRLTGPDGRPAFHTFWSRDDRDEFSLEGEKRAFEALVDLLIDRLDRDPAMHVYHYAPYETTALKRLMSRHGTREMEIDRLLRGGTMVDLHRAVRQGVRASVESYSIKKLEPLYGFRREIDLRDAGSSIVAFEAWLETGGRDAEGPGDAGALERIERYNQDDCVSNWRLRDWLEERRADLARELHKELPRPAPQEDEPAPNLSERLAAVEAVAARLASDVPADRVDRSDEQQARWLLAQLLSWHRREDKSFWWLYYHLMNDLTDAERLEEDEPLAGLEYEGIVGEVAKSYIHRYRFPPQEHEVGDGVDVRDPATGNAPGTVVGLDEARGTVDLKRARTSDVPHPTSLVPFTHYETRVMEDSLLRVGDWVASHGLQGAGEHSAARELLLCRPPRVGQAADGPLRLEDESGLEAARRLVGLLDGSVLAIQGPPGAGKTYTAARMILDLVRAGKRVGVTATSHKVIGNLLDAVGDAALEERVTVRSLQKPAGGEPCTSRYAEEAPSNAAVAEGLASGEAQVAGGTTWLWSREEMAGTVDVLFIDEAGQMSLANAIAVSPAGRSLVLLGDPQQLDQPLQGVHPQGAERSALGHLLGDAATIPASLGLFLERTWRLHPDVCRFTSEAFYESRLEPEPHLAVQALVAEGLLQGTGIRFVPVAHEGNVNESLEEAGVVAGLVRSLVEEGATWADQKGVVRRVTYRDVLVVAPYNAQVQAIARSLPPEARVGTVDKFQGQEAAVSIYSMATSSPEAAPRGMEFLYSLNRLNVASSRARCLAVVVANPSLVRVRCKTPRQMRLANALCRLVRDATVVDAGPVLPHVEGQLALGLPEPLTV